MVKSPQQIAATIRNSIFGNKVMGDPSVTLTRGDWFEIIRHLESYPGAFSFDLNTHLQRQILFSHDTFGPGERRGTVIAHITKELREIAAAEGDAKLEEWIDVIILGFDGAWRSIYGDREPTFAELPHTATLIIQKMLAKQFKNEGRKWPDWRDIPDGQAIEHVRSGDDDDDGA